MTSATVDEELLEKFQYKTHLCLLLLSLCDPRKHYLKTTGTSQKRKKTIELKIKMECLEENQQVSPTKETLSRCYFQMIPYLYNLKW